MDMRLVVCALALCSASACSVMNPSSSGSPKNVPVTDVPRSGYDSISHDIHHPRVAELWQRAEAQRKNGNYKIALLHLEEAQRITPTDAVILSRMAELHLRVNDAVSAERTAKQSNAEAKRMSNLALLYRNWLIIQRSMELQGRIVEAEEARQRATLYR